MKAADAAKANYYVLLGAAPAASPDELHTAFRGKAMDWHPDRCPNDENAAQVMACLNRAYSTLRNPAERRKYDVLNKTADRLCAACAGRGLKKRQSGFKKVVMAACEACGASGWRDY